MLDASPLLKETCLRQVVSDKWFHHAVGSARRGDPAPVGPWHVALAYIYIYIERERERERDNVYLNSNNDNGNNNNNEHNNDNTKSNNTEDEEAVGGDPDALLFFCLLRLYVLTPSPPTKSLDFRGFDSSRLRINGL